MREEYLKRLQKILVKKGSFQKYEILSSKVEMLKYEELLLLLSKEEVEGFIQYLWTSLPNSFMYSELYLREVNYMIDKEVEKLREEGKDRAIDERIERILRTNRYNGMSRMERMEEERELYRRFYIDYLETEARNGQVEDKRVRLFRLVNRKYRECLSKYIRLVDYTNQYYLDMLSLIPEDLGYDRVKGAYKTIKDSVYTFFFANSSVCEFSNLENLFYGDKNLYCKFKVSKEQSDILLNSFLFKLLGLDNNSIKYEDGILSVTFKSFNDFYGLQSMRLYSERRDEQAIKVIIDLIFNVLARTFDFYISYDRFNHRSRENLPFSEIEMHPIESTIGYSVSDKKYYLNFLDFCLRVQNNDFTVES